MKKNNTNINDIYSIDHMRHDIDTNAHVLMHFLKKHMDNWLIHVSPEDRDRWDNKADRSALDNIKQNIINTINNGDVDLTGYAKLSDLNDYIRKGSLLGHINGKEFWHNGSITLTAEDLGITNNNGSTVQYTPNENLSISTTGMYTIGTLKINGEPHILQGVNTASGGNADITVSYNDLTGGGPNHSQIGTLTINGQSVNLFLKDQIGEGSTSTGGVTVSYVPWLGEDGVSLDAKGLYNIGTLTIGRESYVLQGVNTGSSSNIVVYNPDDPNMPDPNDPENPGENIYNVYNTQYINNKFFDIQTDLDNLRWLNELYTKQVIEEMLLRYRYYKDKYGEGYFEETLIDEKTKAWLKTVGLLKEDGTVDGIWSTIKQTYNTLEGDVNLIKTVVYGEDNEGNQWSVNDFLNTKFQEWVNADGTATGAILNSLATRASVEQDPITGEEYERVLKMLIGGFRTYADFNQAIAQLYADVRTEDGSASTAFVEAKAAQNRALIAALSDVTTYKILRNEYGVPYVTSSEYNQDYDLHLITELNDQEIVYPMHYVYLDENDSIIDYPLQNKDSWVIDSSKQAGVVTEASLDEAMALIFAKDNQGGAIALIIAKIKNNKSLLELTADDINLDGKAIFNLINSEDSDLGGHVRILSGVITSYPGSDAGTTQEASIYPGGFLAIDTYTDENAPYSRMDHEGVRTNGYISAESGYKYGEDNPGITQDVTIGDKKLIIKGGIITGVLNV